MRFSVIIPVYNAEKTLYRCIDSLLVQNYADAEIILVNDGSQDSSGMICEKYAKDHKNIRCISKQNGGVSSARNSGLDAARGDYILFVDSDDYVTPDFFSVIENAVQTEKADLIQLSGCFDNGNERKDCIRKHSIDRSRAELMPHLIDAICRKTINSPWAKIYRRDILEKRNIRFPVGVSVGEDRAFNIAYSLFIESYAVSENVVYVVNTQNENSLSRKRHEDLQKQFMLADEYLLEKLDTAQIPQSEKEGYRRAINVGRCRSIYHDAKLLVQDREGWFSRQKILFRRCKKINRMRMKYPKSGYCKLITLPVRLYLTPVIDAIALRQA